MTLIFKIITLNLKFHGKGENQSIKHNNNMKRLFVKNVITCISRILILAYISNVKKRDLNTEVVSGEALMISDMSEFLCQNPL